MTKKQIHRTINAFCRKMKIKRYTINEDNSVDVEDSVCLNEINLGEIPIQFGEVNGSFKCKNSGLTTLKGCPRVVRWNFICTSNKITSLEHGPVRVGMNCVMFDNPLENLEHLPEFIGGYLYVPYYKYLNKDFFDPIFEREFDMKQIIINDPNIDLDSLFRIWILKNIIND